MQQQRQHQQTANAVLSQSGAPPSLHGQHPVGPSSADQQKVNQRMEQMHLRSDQIAKGADTILVNYRVSGGAPGRVPQAAEAANGQRLPDAYHTGAVNGNRSGKIHSSHQAQVVQVLTPQIYSQQRQRVPTGILPSGAGGVTTMHNTQQMVSGPVPANSMMVPTAHPGVASLTQAQAQHIASKVAAPGAQAAHQQLAMNASQSYQQPSGHQQVFFKKRASSNTNPPNHTQSIVQNSPPKAIDKGPGSATESGQQMDKAGHMGDPKGSEGGKVSSPKTSAGAASSMQAPSTQGQQQSSTSASSMAPAQSQNAQQTGAQT